MIPQHLFKSQKSPLNGTGISGTTNLWPVPHPSDHRDPTVTLFPGLVVTGQPPTARAWCLPSPDRTLSPASPDLPDKHLPLPHLETTSGRISIFNILIKSSPGNWK